MTDAPEVSDVPDVPDVPDVLSLAGPPGSTTADEHSRDDLPVPGRTRWQPLRAGLVDVFRYDVEEFRFRDGNLLLRGHNGTGKSKVLALMLPFLLDGDISPHRVEPDASPDKRMEWNLLLGGAYPERTGYTWLELGRLDDDGRPQHRTLAIGMKAVAGKGVRTWFVVTPQRVGLDLPLTVDGRASTRDRLADAVPPGDLVDRVVDYRRLVDEHLFGLGEQRYRALLDLLVQLRQPQLSKKPDEERLSRALSDALPPVDEDLVLQTADAMAGLESEKAEVASLREVRDAAAGYLEVYRRLAQVAARRAGRPVRRAQSEHEDVGRRLLRATEAAEQAEAAEAEADARVVEVLAARDRLDESDRVLRSGEAMRSAERLDALGRDLDAAQSRLADAGRRAEQADAERERADVAVRRAAGRREEAAGRLGRTRDEVRQVAGRAGADLPVLPDADAADEVVGAATRAATAATGARQAAVDELRRLLGQVARAEGEVAAAVRRADDADADAARAVEARQDASAAREVAVDERETRARRALDAAEELAVGDVDTLLAGARGWAVDVAGPDPLGRAVAEARTEAERRLATAEAQVQTARRDAQGRRDELAAETVRLRAGEDLVPPVPHTRRADVRRERPGAPLWQLVDFSTDVDEPARAGLEAALEASGLLDAWVAPDGALLDAEDTLLVTPDDDGARPERSLADVLVPAADREDPRAAAVGDDVLAGLLQSVALGDEGAARPVGGRVGTDGRWSLGVVAGRWSKERARYVGRGAREQARRARLAELEQLLAAVDEELRDLAVRADALAGRRRRLAEEVASVGDDTAVRAAVLALDAARRAEQAAAERRDREAQAVLRAREVLRDATTARDEAAADLRLPVDEAGLADVAAALGELRAALAALWPLLREAASAAEREAEAADDLARASGRADEAFEVRRAARTEVERRRAERDEVRRTVGAAVEELQRRLEEVRRERDALDAAERTARARAREAIVALGEARGEQATLAEQQDGLEERRREAVEALRGFVLTGLLPVALPEIDVPDADEWWSVRAAVQLARRVEELLAEVDDSDEAHGAVLQAAQDGFGGLQTVLLRADAGVVADQTPHGPVVTARWHGRDLSPGGLVTAVGADLGAREQHLSAQERAYIETYLVEDAGGRLAELVDAAVRTVEDVNTELAARPTSTGMTLRFRWVPREDGPAGLVEARERLLRQSVDVWTEDDRDAVAAFLQAQVEAERASDETAGWAECLRRALDYRAWHRFEVQRRRDGQWVRAAGPGSGGEQALVASVPLFAAAASYYNSAAAHAPRLVLLDEAFAGVDDDNRAKCLGLLAEFDLDYVLTSEREWGCYPSVPGLSIAHLSRVDGVDGVLVTHWEWDGSRRTPVEVARPALV